ncbi:hypothetical protein WR25_03116 [Diploscapter pachys]|uniref:SLC26A/SulP transporter domain-containing protein n=1 Tax=Diploscapter pachys TaxID=2018661 RepID=A0A2A2KHN3_9BILA|nr:hypothetical protein WR25_03116 [Diploscapter pachys]
MWTVCFILTITGLEPINGAARTDSNASTLVLREAPWFRVPHPGDYGMPTINAGLCIAFIASCIAGTIENLGSYEILARTSEQPSPPKHAVNRAILCEGLGTMLSSSLGLGAGVTTYTENIALIQFTRVASRCTMQAAGIVLICAGIFTKVAAILATIPEALYGGILAMGASIIAGVAFNNLQV